MARTSTKLFVYGTLRKDAGTEFSRLLAGLAVDVGPARTRGRLFHLGEYPGMTVSEGDAEAVIGELYELRDPAATWPILDSYEGCGVGDTPPFEFERRLIRVRMDDGHSTQAWAYIYRGDTANKPEIVSGDYLQPVNR